VNRAVKTHFKNRCPIIRLKKKKQPNEHFIHTTVVSTCVMCSQRKEKKISPENNPWHTRALHYERDKICDEHIPDQGEEWKPLIKYRYKVK